MNGCGSKAFHLCFQHIFRQGYAEEDAVEFQTGAKVNDAENSVEWD